MNVAAKKAPYVAPALDPLGTSYQKRALLAEARLSSLHRIATRSLEANGRDPAYENPTLAPLMPEGRE